MSKKVEFFLGNHLIPNLYPRNSHCEEKYPVILKVRSRPELENTDACALDDRYCIFWIVTFYPYDVILFVGLQHMHTYHIITRTKANLEDFNTYFWRIYES